MWKNSKVCSKNRLYYTSVAQAVPDAWNLQWPAMRYYKKITDSFLFVYCLFDCFLNLTVFFPLFLQFGTCSDRSHRQIHANYGWNVFSHWKQFERSFELSSAMFSIRSEKFMLFFKKNSKIKSAIHIFFLKLINRKSVRSPSLPHTLGMLQQVLSHKLPAGSKFADARKFKTLATQLTSVL